MYPLSLDHIEGIFYINLNHREDRKKETEDEFNKINLPLDKVTRIEAYYDELNGIRACAQSHANALDLAINQNLNNVLIIEDDCTFIKSRDEIDNYINQFFSKFKNQWDVFFLATWPLYTQKIPLKNYTRILFSIRATAYLVNKYYMPILRDFYLDRVKDMEKDLFYTFSGPKSLDRKWHKLQIKDRWFSGLFPVALQRASYSDIDRIEKPFR